MTRYCAGIPALAFSAATATSRPRQIRTSPRWRNSERSFRGVVSAETACVIRKTILVAAAVCACSSSDGTEPEPLPGNFTLALQSVASGLSNPVYVTTPPGDSRLFVVEQAGRIRIVQNGQLATTPFLDITSRVASGGERGLLSVAFHPQFQSNGFFYVYFTGLSGEIRVERFA